MYSGVMFKYLAKGRCKMNLSQALIKYEPYNEQEEKDKKIMLQCLEQYDDLYTRDNELVHITSSGFVVNRARDKSLMVHHNIYNSWSWTGGHADGDKDLLYVAKKEVMEETGLKDIEVVSEEFVSIDMLPVLGHRKNGTYVAPHLHMSIAYIVEAREDEEVVVKPDENSDVQWIPFDEVTTFSSEEHMNYLYNKIMSKIKKYNI